MNPSEIGRYALLAGLLVVAYLLVLAWNEDYGDPARGVDASAVAADPLTDVPPGPAAEAGTEPGSGAGSAPADVPAVRDLEVPGRDAGAERSRDAVDGTLVRVRTDVLNLWIDRRGGDIVKVTLPTYPVSLDTPDVPFTLLDRTPDFVYVAQSGLAGPDGSDAAPDGRPRYAVDADLFELAPGADTLVVPLRHTDERGVTTIKRFVLRRGDHAVRMELEVRNPTSRPLRVNLYGQIKRSPGMPPDQESSGLGPRPYVGAAFTTPESRYEKVDFDDLDDEPWQTRLEGGWLAMLQHYFLSAWIPVTEAEHLYRGRRGGDGTYLVEFVGPTLTVPAGEERQLAARFYAGPKDQDRLEALAPNLSLTVDYGFLWWIAVPLFKLLDLLHALVRNWGVAIVLLTLLIKLALYPLSAASYRSMANMRKVAPEMKRLQERYADDRQKLSQEMMNLYKKERINPLGGCLPMLLQMPVFLALYWVLYESVELRQADFLLWIDDLSALDQYFVLPLLMGATMYFQQTLNPPPPDPTQARVLKLMPVMFTGLFLFFPAGLVLYWLTNNVLSIAQQWWITRQIEGASAAAK